MNDPLYSPNSKTTIAIDFDGTCHRPTGQILTNGYLDVGPVCAGLGEFLSMANHLGYEVVVHSAREDTDTIEAFFIKHGLWQYIRQICPKKPKALFYVDDRGVRFDGSWSMITHQICSDTCVFIPWYKNRR